MAWVAEHHLAAAVSEAGGLGLIGAASAPGEWVREQIRKVKERTEKPFGVNIMLMSPYADEVAKVVAEEGVKVVTTGAGNPEKYMKLWKDAGIKVIPVVASVALAKRMERCGADAVVAEGSEAGGHIGRNTTMVSSSDCRCSIHPSHCSGRNCRWARGCSILDAGGIRSAGWHTLCRDKGVGGAREL